MKISLEDNFDDILRKAQRGLDLTANELAQRARLTAADVEKTLTGTFNEVIVQELALQLDLGAQALIAIGRHAWYPADPGNITGLVPFHTPYAGMIVNSYLVFDPATKTAAAFDTTPGMVDFLRQHQLALRDIFLTHTHSDHILGLDRLQQTTGATIHTNIREPLLPATEFNDNSKFSLGNLLIETRPTTGHTRGGTTYIIAGLTRRLAFCGDALFAGSMGGAAGAYQEALHTNRENIFTLPDDTVLCCGHGPLTTVGEERQHNPFFTGKT